MAYLIKLNTTQGFVAEGGEVLIEFVFNGTDEFESPVGMKCAGWVPIRICSVSLTYCRPKRISYELFENDL